MKQSMDRSLNCLRPSQLRAFAYARSNSSSASPILPISNISTPVRLPPLSIMPFGLLLRSYFITSILASPRILRLSLPLMNKIANAHSPILNPDRNPLLHVLVRKFIYDHFAAGETVPEVRKSVTEMKRLGFNGVILGYAKEVNITGGSSACDGSESTSIADRCIQAWKEGTLRTLGCIAQGDFLAVKFSGAGPSVLEALIKHQSPPPPLWNAILEICETAAQQNTRVWIDAEQQNIQPAIDSWTINLMRKFNRNGNVTVYTTIQAYLKQAPDNISKHLQLAQDEGWALGIKLVRGAYIATEKRELIHDTIEDTHQAYNTTVEQLLKQKFPGISPNKPYPKTALFLATHNDASIKKAYAVQKSLILAGEPTIDIGYGQLQGMADEVSCGLLQLCQAVQPEGMKASNLKLAPRAFKCLSWGTTQETLQFLLRRVKENGDALGRTKYWVASFREEIWRRVKGIYGA